MIGALVIVMIAIGLPLLFNNFRMTLDGSASNLAFSLIAVLLGPVAGGFLAGWIGRPKPRQAGLIAGTIASLLVLAAWLVITGVSLQTFISGGVVVFVWVVLARLASGFAQPSLKK